MSDVDPFQGRGVKLANGGWVPNDHPLAKQAQAGGGAAAGGGGAAASGPAATNVQDQAKAASTYSATPGAAPGPNATNQGTTDVVRNSYLAQATQDPNQGANDPAVRSVANAQAAAVDRNRQQYLDEAAEKAGPYGSGTMAGERRMTAEAAGQQKGSFEAQLVLNQNNVRRQEIQAALGALAGLGESDRKAQLQRELAALDAQNARLGIETQRYGIDVGARTAGQELALKAAALKQDDKQFNKNLGFNMADREAYYNNLALQSLF